MLAAHPKFTVQHIRGWPLFLLGALLAIGVSVPAASPAAVAERSVSPPPTAPDPPPVPALWMPVAGAVVRGFDARAGPYGPGHRGSTSRLPSARWFARRRREGSSSPARWRAPTGSASWSPRGAGHPRPTARPAGHRLRRTGPTASPGRAGRPGASAAAGCSPAGGARRLGSCRAVGRVDRPGSSRSAGGAGWVKTRSGLASQRAGQRGLRRSAGLPGGPTEATAGAVAGAWWSAGRLMGRRELLGRCRTRRPTTALRTDRGAE
jgi:hypothetical protein